MSAAAVEVRGLTLGFGRKRVLDGVDLSARSGIVTVLGANGAGKTTLLRCVATVLAPDGGTVTIDDLNADREAERIEIRRRLGYLPQHVAFSPSATVYDALDYSAVLKEMRDDRTRRRQVVETLDRVGLRDRMADPIRTLSGGMRQRLGLAHALLDGPSLLVLDEPSAGLDPDERLRFREIIAERRAMCTIIVSTHLTDEAALGDRVVVLHHGRICFSGAPRQLADVASGHTWVQTDLPPPNVRASWRQADGRHRCLGVAPSGVALVPPTIEDGYLMVTRPEMSVPR